MPSATGASPRRDPTDPSAGRVSADGSGVWLLAEAAQALALPVLVIDHGGCVLAANDAWSQLSGLSPDASSGTGWLAAVHRRDRGALTGRLLEMDGDGLPGTGDYRLVVGGGVRWARWWWRTAGRSLAVCLSDIHDDKTREAALYERATHDPLTGLVNRSHFLELVGQAIRRLDRTRTTAAVIFVDLDRFKDVNDRAGHSTGDQVLAAAAARLGAALRPSDVVARVGGDEFAVLCQGVTGLVDAESVVARAAEAFAHPLDSPGQMVVGATMGISLAAGSHDDPEALLARADRAMYEAKRRSEAAWRTMSARRPTSPPGDALSRERRTG